VYVHAGANGLQISNNVIVGNSGSYGGGVRVGTPYAGDTNNDSVAISFNQIRDNGGTNLAGGVGIYNGSTSYVVDHNALCGNFSAEYGGGISHYGLSAGGRITSNRIWFNESYDEGGGVMIAGELPADPNGLSAGAGAVTVSGNQIIANNANDDGGGMRLLQVNNYLVRAENNVIANNLSTHEGGGIAIDDASNVELVNNTVAENITSATALTSDGTAAPAGLAWGPNSSQLQASLTGTPQFSPPRLLNNIFHHNKSGAWDGQMVHGIGIAGDTAVQNFWDMGSTTPGAPALQPRYGVMSQLNSGQATTAVAGRLPGTDVPDTDTAANVSPYFTRVTADAGFVAPFSVTVDVSSLRSFPGFRQSVIVLPNVAPDQLGNYHLRTVAAGDSVAVNRGVALLGTITAPTTDFDDPPTPRYAAPATTTKLLDAGADER
jgi:parallel beta-helix repeat protein